MSARSKYAEAYRDPRWQKKRLEIMERDGFQCCSCGDDSSTLNVHHRYYVPGRTPWEYPAFALTTLCEWCHKWAHEIGPKERPWEIFLDRVFSEALFRVVDDAWRALKMSRAEFGELLRRAVLDASQACATLKAEK